MLGPCKDSTNTMFNHIRPSLHESRVEYAGVKPLQKYGKRLDKYLPLRIAGKIWQTSETEEKINLKHKNLRYASLSGPVGLGFSVGDNYGPDDSFNTKENLNNIYDQDYYTNQ